MTKSVQTNYTCPVCESKREKLLVIMDPLDYGDVKVLLSPVDEAEEEIWLEFDIRESNFFYCNCCKMRFSRVKPAEFSRYEERKIPGVASDCILKECREKKGGRIETYKDVVVGDIFMKGEGPGVARRRKRIRGLLQKVDLDEVPDAFEHFLEEFGGEFTLDQAGICNECRIVVVRNVDMK